MEYIILIPLLASLISFFIPKKFAKEFGLSFSLSFFLFTLSLYYRFQVNKDFNFPYHFPFLNEIGCNIFLGIDSLGYLMILLTNFVVLYVNFMAWTKFQYSKNFFGLVFLMQFALIGVFSSLNGLLFYFFWELALLPIYLIVVKWGEGENTIKVFSQFFIVTFVGSLSILAALIYFNYITGCTNFDYTEMIPKGPDGTPALLFSLLMMIGLGVKIPIFTLHFWQAKTYQKSPTEGTILLSGIMLKMGLYGMLRWLVPFIDIKQIWFQHIVMILAIIGIIYGAILALRRNDLKLIAAYSSLSHVGMIIAGILSFKIIGFQGSIFQMVIHGINIVGIFYIIDYIERQTKTRDLRELGGIVSMAPKFTVLSFIIILGSIAVPLTNGFSGEFTLLLSVFLYSPLLGIIAGLSIIIGAAYMLRIFQRSFMGEVSPLCIKFKDVTGIDFIALFFISILVLLFGIFPNLIFNFTAILTNNLNNLLLLRH